MSGTAGWEGRFFDDFKVARESRSRPGWGIVKVKQRGITQDGTVVLVMARSFMVPKRDSAKAPVHFPQPKQR